MCNCVSRRFIFTFSYDVRSLYRFDAYMWMIIFCYHVGNQKLSFVNKDSNCICELQASM